MRVTEKALAHMRETGQKLTDEALAHMREAGQVLHTAVLRWILSILARSATTDVVDTQPRYILLRQNAAESWDIKDYKMFCYDHVRTARRPLISFQAPPTAMDFQVFASVFYMG